MEIRKMIKILIVDDEKPICDLIDLNLSSAGYHCISVQDGLKAINRIEEEDFDLVLLDIMLPGADGYDIMEYIRPLKIPVIFITAKHEVKDRVKGLKLGADDYLVKPFSYTELLSRVKALLRRCYQYTGTAKPAAKVLYIHDLQIDLDKQQLIAEHAERKNEFLNKLLLLENSRNTTDWDKIMALYSKMEEEIK